MYGGENLMQYYRCACGHAEAWGSMPPYPCSGCADCGTTLDQHPQDHRTPEPHDFVPYPVETAEGDKTISRCRWCHRTRKEVETHG